MGNQSRVGFHEDSVGGAAATGGWGDKGSNSDSVSTSGSLPSREQSPVVLPPSRLQNGESSSEAAGIIVTLCMCGFCNDSDCVVLIGFLIS